VISSHGAAWTQLCLFLTFMLRYSQIYFCLTKPPHFHAIFCGVRIKLACLFVPRPIWRSWTWRSEINLDPNCKPSLGREAKSLMGHPLPFLCERRPLKQTNRKSGYCMRINYLKFDLQPIIHILNVLWTHIIFFWIIQVIRIIFFEMLIVSL
jgi:hypothetical protein